MARGSARQRGAALLLVVALVAIGATFLLMQSINAATWRADRYRLTQQALAMAKEALIARAVADDNRPGSLPCPDTNNDGNAELFAGSQCPSYIGRLPWKTLDVPDLRDASGERLWYVLSPTHRDHASAEPINSNTVGQLSVTGTQPATNVLAVVVAPGPALIRSDSVAQERSCTTACSAQDFLDLAGGVDNAASAATWTLISAAESQSFNDRMLAIQADDVMPLVEKRAGRELAAHLRTHYDAWQAATIGGAKGFYPWASSFTDPSLPSSGVSGTRDGLLPVNDSAVVWDTASPGLICSGVNTKQLYCSITLTGVGGLLSVTGTVRNVATAFVDPPTATNVDFTGLVLLPSYTWILDSATQTLHFSFSAWLIGLGSLTVQAPQASAWTTNSWLVNNRWYETAYYALSPNFAITGNGSCGTCLSVSNTPSSAKQAVVVMTGRALAGQNARPVTPPAALADYLEGGNTDPTDLAFEHAMRTVGFNDQPVVVRP